MKTARQRAEEAVRLYINAADARSFNEGMDALTRLFAEHARDQRLLCAEAASSIGNDGGDDADYFADRARAEVMNARAPGT